MGATARPLSRLSQNKSPAHLFLDLLDLLAVLVKDVLADKVRPLELLARQRAQPLVLPKFLQREGNQFNRT